MKKIVASLIIILFHGMIFSQTKVKPVVGVSERFSINNLLIELLGISTRTVGFHAGTFGEIGINLETKKIEYSILGSYGVEFVLGEKKYMGHLVGLGLKFRFQKEKKIGFLLSLNSHYQLSSNYSLAYMQEGGWFSDKPQGHTVSFGSHGGPPYSTIFHTDFYIRTPFIGNIFAGIDYHVFEGFHLSLSIGSGIRIFKTKHASWSSWTGDPFYEHKKLETKPEETNYGVTMDFELGVRYAFPLKKTSKTH